MVALVALKRLPDVKLAVPRTLKTLEPLWPSHRTPVAAIRAFIYAWHTPAISSYRRFARLSTVYRVSRRARCRMRAASCIAHHGYLPAVPSINPSSGMPNEQ